MKNRPGVQKAAATTPRPVRAQNRFSSIEEFKKVFFPNAFARENEADDSGSAIGEQLAEQSKSVVRAAFAIA
ncbi:MAG: hypothetical protein ABI540_03470 [Spartobacteria bacterium]